MKPRVYACSISIALFTITGASGIAINGSGPETGEKPLKQFAYLGGEKKPHQDKWAAALCRAV